METIISKLNSVKMWLSNPFPPEHSSDDDYMHYIMELMSYAHYSIKVSASICPTKL